MQGFTNFAEGLAREFKPVPESQVHPHTGGERAGKYHAIDPGAAELEVLNFLNALVYLFKPILALETGTGTGLSALAILSALLANGQGDLHTVDADAGATERARELVTRLSPATIPQATFYTADSLKWIETTTLSGFDFVFFDSLIAFRHREFEALQKRRLLAPGAVCVFHDTSRRRGEYYDDFNPEMIAALDEASSGKQWLECEYSRGLRVIRLDPT